MNVLATSAEPESCMEPNSSTSPVDIGDSPLGLAALPVIIPQVPASGPTPLWRPGIDETPVSMEKKPNGILPPEDDEEEEEEDDEDDDDDEDETNGRNFQSSEGGCGSPDSNLRKSSPTSKKGSREQTKIQPLRLDSGLEAFRCPLCFPDCAPANCAPIAGRKALTEHLRWHQNQEQQAEGRFACCYCAKELSSYSSLDRHLLTHTNFRPFVCTQCKRDFTTNGNLNRHVKTSHQGMRNGATMATLTEEIPSTVSVSSASTSVSSSVASIGKAVPRPSLAHTKIVGVTEAAVTPSAVSATVNAVASSNASLDLSSVSHFPSHSNSFGLGQSSGLPTLAGNTFVPSCLSLPPVAAAAAAAASALMPSSTNPVFSSLPSPYNTAHWLTMLMRGYGANHPIMPLSLSTPPPPPFLAHGPSSGLLPTSTGASDLLDLPAEPMLSGRPMPVLTPQNSLATSGLAGTALTAEDVKDKSQSSSPDVPTRSSGSPRSTPAGSDLRGLLRQRPKHQDVKRKGVTRLRSVESKKLLYKAGLQHWGRVLRGKAIDFLKRKQKRSYGERASEKTPASLVVSTPIRAEEDFGCPLDLTIKSYDSINARQRTPRDIGPELERHPIVSSFPTLTPANGANADDSVLDLSVRSSSLSDGASPPNAGHNPVPINLGLGDHFMPPLLAAPPQHGVPILHMRQEGSPPSIQLQALLESNNNCSSKADSLFGIIDPKKKIDETAKIFTGRYAKRRPQKKTHLAPPTLNPFLKVTPTSQTNFSSETSQDNQMDVDLSTSDTHSETAQSFDGGSKGTIVNRKKNSYKDAPNRMLCPIEGCEQQFPWKSSLKRHVITHYDFKPYKCVTCGRHFSTKSNRERHIERLHGHRNKRLGRVQRSVVENVEPEDNEAVLAAPLASEDIESMNFSDMKADRMSEEILEKAGTIVTAPNPERMTGAFTASRLGRQNTAPEANVFSRSANGTDLPTKNPVCCQCLMEIPGGAQAMQLHMRSVHQSGLTAGVPTVSVAAAAAAVAAAAASAAASAPSTPDSSSAVFKCPVCAREFHRQEPALEHMRVTHPSEWAMTASKLNVDSLIQGAGANNGSASSWTEGSPSGGEEADGVAKRVMCPVCRRKFASFQDLQRHARSHTGERPFVCSYCGREFALKHSLNRHMRTHVSCTSGSGEEL